MNYQSTVVRLRKKGRHKNLLAFNEDELYSKARVGETIK